MIRFALLFIALLYSTPFYAQTKKAFLVGISKYRDYNPGTHWNDINGANDVRLLAPILRKQGFTIDSLTNKNATYGKIISRLDAFTKKCKAGDIVYLHFSCHGQPFEDLNGDEKDGWDESLVPVDADMVFQKGKYEGNKHLTDDRLQQYISNIRKKVGTKGMVYVVLDACHSGDSSRDGDMIGTDTIVRGTTYGFSKNNKPYRVKREMGSSHYKVSKVKDWADVVYLEACRSYQYNVEIVEKGKHFGSLSYYVAKELQTVPLNQNMNWVWQVEKNMKSDRRLWNQTIVIESSK